MRRKLPIGIQSFEVLRGDGFLYVDKTAYVHRLVEDGVPCFLSRPRRFGKSLLVSTLKAYFEGRRDLFEGLAIEQLEGDGPDAWQARPVFHFDFTGADYGSTPLEDVLDEQLSAWEGTYGTGAGVTLGGRFQSLLERAHTQSGHRCAVLVDEYDKPLLDVMGNEEMERRNRSVFKGFFSVLKKADSHLRFVLITGVTKFSKVSLFSDLNQLRDISLSADYAGVCGITEEELSRDLAPHIEALGKTQGLSVSECKEELASMYDGYRFHWDGPGVYNPFSLLSSFADGELGSYWFATGTPTFLVKKIRAAGFDPKKLTDNTLWASESQMTDYRFDDPDPVPLLYQTGYLTIRGYDRRRRRYTLGIPNGEVKYGLMESLANEYAPATTAGRGADVYTLDDHVESGDLDGIRDVLTALFASIPYTRAGDPFENYFQGIIFTVFTLLGRFVGVEMHTAMGRVDCIVETQGYVYLFEFKRDGTAKEALEQIDERGYALAYASDPRTLYRVGCTFDTTTRLLSGWEVRQGTAYN